MSTPESSPTDAEALKALEDLFGGPAPAFDSVAVARALLKKHRLSENLNTAWLADALRHAYNAGRDAR